MLARCSSKLAALFLLFVPFVSEVDAAPRDALARNVIELPDFAGDTVKLFKDWCKEQGVAPVMQGVAGGAPLTKHPKEGTVKENGELSPPGGSVDPRDPVYVVLEEVEVPDFASKTAGEFRAWCRDWGMSSRFTTASGNILINPPSEDIIADNESTGHVAVGSTVGVILDGPYYLTATQAFWYAAIVLILAVAISLVIGGYSRRARVK